MNVRMLVAVALWALPGCTCSRTEEKAAPSTSAPPAPPGVPPVPESAVPENMRVPSAWPVAVGPILGIFPGEGLGAVRFGATPATIERLLEGPCEIKTDTVCRYIARGVEFRLK